MSWMSQNLDLPVRDAKGPLWHFRVWSGSIDGVRIQRIFFWDESLKTTGYAEFAADQTLHVRQIRQRIRKIVKDGDYRARFLRELDFPLERHYS